MHAEGRPFDALAGATCVVTGGLGFIGGNVARTRAAAGATLRVVDALVPDHGVRPDQRDGCAVDRVLVASIADPQVAELLHLVHARAYGLRATSLRLTNVFGRRRRLSGDELGFLPVLLRRTLIGEEIRIDGDASVGKADDVGDADAHALDDIATAIVATAGSGAGRRVRAGARRPRPHRRLLVPHRHLADRVRRGLACHDLVGSGHRRHRRVLPGASVVPVIDLSRRGRIAATYRAAGPQLRWHAAECISVPCFPEMTDAEIDHVATALAALPADDPAAAPMPRAVTR